jgi:sulfur relay (sulfurtransferase) DsrF/TusC family protein
MGGAFKTYTDGVSDILSEQDALELDQEEVQELREVLKNSLVGLLRDGVVSAGAERAGDALLENDMACNLNCGGHYQAKSVSHSGNHRSRDQLTSQRHVQKLEGPAKEG